jgi:hypothetical protein
MAYGEKYRGQSRAFHTIVLRVRFQGFGVAEFRKRTDIAYRMPQIVYIAICSLSYCFNCTALFTLCKHLPVM